MENKTLSNQLFYKNNSQNANSFNKIIDFAVEKFCNSIGFNKNFFSQFLPYSESQFPKYINHNDDTKNLKSHDLIHILDNLDKPHQKLILDYLAQRYEATFIFNDSLDDNNQSLEHILLSITATDGELSKQFLNAIEDNNIDDNEIKQLKEIAYKLRSLLRVFESRVNR
ncbi:hypothetical protein CRV02_08300 [Arcobacter sp. CECT 8989]|uniref:hypothetical protein n=1 Tax=Arcobacter sp. CECT 8989 TaxID=2044509 RepID=UPI00100BECAA|nr:hypothetical protein [Arcobacter sp. CECT 8989]RXK01500.1 hypothetical protein CRV02_08300 [Arcobacter sp. CECT 8989]